MVKTPHKDNTNTAEWPSLTIVVPFNVGECGYLSLSVSVSLALLPRLDEQVTVQLFDHRTILSDTLMGELVQPLRFFTRAHATVARDKNHPSIIAWSIGNA